MQTQRNKDTYSIISGDGFHHFSRLTCRNQLISVVPPHSRTFWRNLPSLCHTMYLYWAKLWSTWGWISKYASSDIHKTSYHFIGNPVSQSHMAMLRSEWPWPLDAPVRGKWNSGNLLETSNWCILVQHPTFSCIPSPGKSYPPAQRHGHASLRGHTLNCLRSSSLSIYIYICHLNDVFLMTADHTFFLFLLALVQLIKPNRKRMMSFWGK